MVVSPIAGCPLPGQGSSREDVIRPDRRDKSQGNDKLRIAVKLIRGQAQHGHAEMRRTTAACACPHPARDRAPRLNIDSNQSDGNEGGYIPQAVPHWP